MAIARGIIIKTPDKKFSDAERIWKSQCAPLMQKQKGCRVEKFMRSTESPDLYISYSEWDSMDAIEGYRATTEHATIQSEVRAIQGSRAVVWTYEILD